jgi:hypothetical protein
MKKDKTEGFSFINIDKIPTSEVSLRSSAYCLYRKDISKDSSLHIGAHATNTPSELVWLNVESDKRNGFGLSVGLSTASAKALVGALELVLKLKEGG